MTAGKPKLKTQNRLEATLCAPTSDSKSSKRKLLNLRDGNLLQTLYFVLQNIISITLTPLFVLLIANYFAKTSVRVVQG